MNRKKKKKKTLLNYLQSSTYEREDIVCIGVSTSLPIKNTTPLFFAKPPLKSANCPSPLFLSLTLSHLIEVTEFFVKISQVKFLAMTEKTFLFINFLKGSNLLINIFSIRNDI